MSRSSASSVGSQDSTDAFVATLDLDAISALALTARRNDIPTDDVHEQVDLTSADLACTVVSPPKSGAFNVVYELQFSDGVRWAIRIPIHEWNPTRTRSMYLDVLAQQYITARTSVPIPRIHAYACDEDNSLRHPYLLTDFARGARLVDVWNEPEWWTGKRSKQRFFASLARHMTELAELEFDSIGRLDCPTPDGPYTISPFPSRLAINPDLDGPDAELGPFKSSRAYLGALLDERRRGGDSATLALLSLLLASITDARYDGAPFILGNPDFDSQNVFIDDETAEVTAIIDWDGVAVVPRQLGALSYPSWLTVDWDPIMYPAYQAQEHHDTEADLHVYRTMYADAVDAASGRRFGAVTRNSHVVSAIANAVCSEFTTADIVYHLGKFVFGSSRLTFELIEGIEHGSWYNSSPQDVTQVKVWDKYDQDQDTSSEGGD